MAKFGWKYGISTRPGGPDKSVQFNTGSQFSGSAELTFDYSTNILSASSARVHILTASNLLVEGTQTIISSTHLVIQDPMIGLGFGTATGHTGAVGDRGFVFGLVGDLNQAMIWDQTSGSFIFGKVGSQGPTDSALDILPSNFSTVRVGKLQSIGSISGSSISASGEVFAQTGLRTSGSLKVANISGSGEVFGTSFRTSGSIQAGTISGSTSINAAGEIIFSNNVSVSGSFTQAGGTSQGSITANGAITANAGVKATSYSGSSTLHSVGAASFGSTVHVTGNIVSTNGNISTDNGNVSVGGAGTWYKGPGGGLAISGYISGSGEVFAQTGFRTSGSLKAGNVSGSGEVFGSSLRSSGALTLTGSVSGSGGLNIGGATIISNTLNVTGAVIFASTLTASSAITASAFVGANLNRHFINELTMSRPSVSTIGISTGSCTDSTNSVYMDLTASVTLDITTTGIDALDTGAEATSTWYAVFVVSGTSGMGGLLSTSETSPTMPAGYTYKRRVGWTYNHSDDDLQNFIQGGLGRERAYYWKEDDSDFPRILTNATSVTVTTAADCSARIAPSAHGYYIMFQPGSASDQQYRDVAAARPMALSGATDLHFYVSRGDPGNVATAGGAGDVRNLNDWPIHRGDGQIRGFQYNTYIDGMLNAWLVGWKETI